MQIVLAEQDRARGVEPRGNGRVLGRHAVGEDTRTAGRSDPLRVDEILERDGDAVERATVPAGGDLPFGFTRLSPRHLRRHGDKRVQRAAPFDPVQAGLDEGDRRQRTRPDPPR